MRSVYILFIISVGIVCLYSTLFYVLCFVYFSFCILWASGPEIKFSYLILSYIHFDTTCTTKSKSSIQVVKIKQSILVFFTICLYMCL